MIEVASLRYGVIFKKAFSQPYIFTAFVKDLIGIDIEIDKVETEKYLFAEDKKNRVIIDIQHKRYSDHYDRFLHYQPNMQVFTIVVLTSGDKHKTDISITDFEPKKLDGTGIGETQHKIIYVSPKYASDETPEPYREWLKAIDDSLDEQVEESDYNNEIIKDIFALIKKDKITPKEYAKMKNQYSEEEYLKDQKQEAKDTKALEIAKKMLNAGMDIETITAMTGLMPDLIKEKDISFSTEAQDHQKG
ncbi:hypothetical protein [Candidatus Marithrix sp. Canyon 246]|uniref:hypothetical protein n=1 Tax=Candidatus Marithrix sp. Canyon 246 TaxID=1827136 RepID=UPI00084A0D1A|nr:hypothetical protein [Candidatus Marithrix sp. Canyon 246]